MNFEEVKKEVVNDLEYTLGRKLNTKEFMDLDRNLEEHQLCWEELCEQDGDVIGFECYKDCETNKIVVDCSFCSDILASFDK